VSQILAASNTVIVLEDDLVVSKYFLKFMNEGLMKFSDDDRVISIHGYVYPVLRALPEAFFLLGADCWGWATWQRAWEIFEQDSEKLLLELRSRKLRKLFDFNSSYRFSKMLEDQARGKIDSWAIRWNASAFLQGKLTLYPGSSLMHNIGNDGSGKHSGPMNIFDGAVAESPICLDGLSIEEFFATKGRFGQHLRRLSNSVRG
jgi:hypothetical protein